MRKKEQHPIFHLGKIHDTMILFKPASSRDYEVLSNFHARFRLQYQHVISRSIEMGNEFQRKRI